MDNSSEKKDPSVLENISNSGNQEHLAFQDIVRVFVNNRNRKIKLDAENAMEDFYQNDFHRDIVSAHSRFIESLEPWRDSLSKIGKAVNGSQIADLMRELQKSSVIPESTISEYAGIIKQIELVHNLESFKAITRLQNFPFEGVVRIDLDSIPDLEENVSEAIVELDSEISSELSLVGDFNELSEEKRTVLLDLYQFYYYPIILNCLFILIWIQVILDEKLDLTNNTFFFVEKSKEKLSYISNVYRPNPSAMIDNFLIGGILMLLAKAIGW